MLKVEVRMLGRGEAKKRNLCNKMNQRIEQYANCNRRRKEEQITLLELYCGVVTEYVKY